MPQLVKENNARKPGHGTNAIPKDDKQKTLQRKADKHDDQPKPDKQPIIKANSEQKSDKQQKATTEQKPDKQPIKASEQKPDKQQKATTEQKPDKQLQKVKSREQKPDKQLQKATTEQTQDEQQKATTEQKQLDEQPKMSMTKQKQPYMVYNKVDDEQEAPPQHKAIIKHDQQQPRVLLDQVFKVDEQLIIRKQKNKTIDTNQASTSKGPKKELHNYYKPDESKKHDTIDFKKDQYNFVQFKYPLCYACGTYIKGNSVYHCEDKERYLHPFCFRLKPTFSDKARISYTLVESSPIICNWCNIKGDKEELSYVSTTTKDLIIRFHVFCYMELIEENKPKRDVKVEANPKGKGPLKTKEILEKMLTNLRDAALDNMTGGMYSSFSFMLS